MKVNLNWIIDLNIKGKTLKLIEENIGENICDLEVGKVFLGYKKHISWKKNNKFRIHQNKLLTHIHKLKRVSYGLGKMFILYIWEKTFIENIKKKLLVTQDKPIFLKGKRFEHFTQEYMQMANEYVKRCSVCLVIKTTLRYHCIPSTTTH